MVPYIAGGVNKFVISFQHWRFYADDGDSDNDTPLQNEDTNHTLNNDSDAPIHVRVMLEETGAGSVGGAATDDYTLQYRLNGGGSWVLPDSSSTRVQSHAASQLDDNTATLNRASGNGIRENPKHSYLDIQ